MMLMIAMMIISDMKMVMIDFDDVHVKKNERFQPCRGDCYDLCHESFKFYPYFQLYHKDKVLDVFRGLI